MNFTTSFLPLLAPAFAFTLAVAPDAFVSSAHTTPPLAERVAAADVSDEWEFITDSSDGTLYFGGPVTRVGNTAVLQIKAVNDPERPAGEEHQFTTAFNCAKNTIKESDGKWDDFLDNTVGSVWLRHACGASPLKTKKSALA